MRLLLRSSLFLLACIATGAMAEGSASIGDPTNNPQVEDYDYSADLDIARVISIDPVPKVCEVVSTRMTYEDSHAKRHVLRYKVMGDGCSAK